MSNLTKKHKFIILIVSGGTIILGAFIWSMVINLGQVSLSNPVPELSVPEEISEIIDNTRENNNPSTEVKEIAEILEQETNRNSDSPEDNNDIPIDTGLNLDIK
ncbi:MAG: hypothetical protein WD512_14810 [Candidatus Paceibacterota bacterium]